jgi:hypothetical protein
LTWQHPYGLNGAATVSRLYDLNGLCWVEKKPNAFEKTNVKNYRVNKKQYTNSQAINYMYYPQTLRKKHSVIVAVFTVLLILSNFNINKTYKISEQNFS